MSDTTSDEAKILKQWKNIAVVGLSPKPDRASFGVSQYMQARGYRIIPVNPNARDVLGEKAYKSLTEAAAHETIEIVDCFRNSADIPPIVDEAIAIGAKAIWMQLGIENADAAKRAREAGMIVVEDRCIKVDHSILSARGLL